MLALTTLTRNRGWILPDFLEGLLRLDIDRDDAMLVILDDASTDDTPELLRSLQADYPLAFRGGIHVIWSDVPGGAPSSSRDAANRLELYRHLGALRNRVRETILALGATEQFSVDSDILVSPGTVTALRAHRRELVGAALYNDGGPLTWTGGRRGTNFGNLDLMGNYVSPIHLPDRLFAVQITGACALYSERALASRARYGYHPMGEDVAYCLGLLAEGIYPYADTTARVVHVMRPDQREAACALVQTLTPPCQ
jgi:glycosyltransferase involved in cell wall biosynthesis